MGMPSERRRDASRLLDASRRRKGGAGGKGCDVDSISLYLSLSLSVSLSVSLWQRAPTRKIELLVTTARDTIHENISLNHAAARESPHCGALRSRLTLDAYFHPEMANRVIFLFSYLFLCRISRFILRSFTMRRSLDLLSPDL